MHCAALLGKHEVPEFGTRSPADLRTPRTAFINRVLFLTRTGLINSLGIRCGNADSGGDVPTFWPTDPSGGCTGTAMPAGTSVPMSPRYALLPAARRPIAVGFRAPDVEAYLEADGHR